MVFGRNQLYKSDEPELDNDPEWDSHPEPPERVAGDEDRHPALRTKPMLGMATIVALAALLTVGILVVDGPSPQQNGVGQPNSTSDEQNPDSDGSNLDGSPSTTDSGETPGISLSLSPSSDTVTKGLAAQLIVTVQRLRTEPRQL